MAEFGWFLFSAGGAVCVLVGTALWLWRRPSSQSARWCLIGCAAFYAIASSHAFADALEARIGGGFSPLEASEVPAGLTAVVVLGSGGYTARGWDDTPLSLLDPWAAGRVLEAARLFRLLDPAWVVVSGGLPDLRGRDEPTDVIMRRALVDLGVPADRIRTDTRSRDTRAEAAAIAPILRSLGVANTVLVTSRVHMRRAAGTFRAHGVPVIPAPAPDRRTGVSPWRRLVPTETGLSGTATGAHEIAGIAYYMLRGWYEGAP